VWATRGLWNALALEPVSVLEDVTKPGSVDRRGDATNRRLFDRDEVLLAVASLIDPLIATSGLHDQLGLVPHGARSTQQEIYGESELLQDGTSRRLCAKL
jgi:hypothetical protein